MEYYHGQEAEMFTFYRTPKLLFTDERYKPLSALAKMLYGLMLDRMGLSVKNKWQDEQGRIYIFFRQDEAAELLGVGKDKTIKLYRELEQAELIERKRLGLTHPDIIYVGRLTPIPTPTAKSAKAAAKKSKKPTARSRKNRVQETGKTEFTSYMKNETYSTENQSIYQAGATADTPSNAENAPNHDEYEEMFKLYISYEGFKRGDYGAHVMSDIDELVALMADECSSEKPTIRIGGEERPRSDFRNRLLSIDDTSISRILLKMENPDPDKPIQNRRAYLLTMLYNHKSTNPHPDEGIY